MKKLILFLILICCQSFYGQDDLALINDVPNQNCFKDCIKRLKLFHDTLEANDKIRKTSSESSFIQFIEKQNKVIKGLIGCSFPNSPLTSTSNNTISIKQLKGKPVFVKFWFTSCSPCIAEIPSINKLVKEFGNSVTFLSINTDDMSILKEFIAHKEFNTQHVQISRDKASEEFCAIGGYPFNLILDKDGKVTDVWNGGFSDPEKQTDFYNRVKKGLNSLLFQKK